MNIHRQEKNNIVEYTKIHGGVVKIEKLGIPNRVQEQSPPESIPDRYKGEDKVEGEKETDGDHVIQYEGLNHLEEIREYKNMKK